jgi:hypothetical protein
MGHPINYVLVRPSARPPVRPSARPPVRPSARPCRLRPILVETYGVIHARLGQKPSNFNGCCA